MKSIPYASTVLRQHFRKEIFWPSVPPASDGDDNPITAIINDATKIDDFFALFMD